MALIDVLGIIVAIVAVIFVYIKWRYQYWQRKNVPVIPNLDKSNKSLSEGRALVYKYGKSKGWKFFGDYSLLAFPLFFTTDLDLLKNIMTRDFDHFVDRGTYVNENLQPISAHLFAIGGKKWKNLRAKFTPNFTSGKMKTMFKTIVDISDLLDQSLQVISQKKEAVNIKEILVCFTIDVIGSCGFGLECNSFKNPDSPLLAFDKKLLHHSAFKLIKELFCNYFPDKARLLGLTLIDKDVDELFTKIIKDTISYREKNSIVRNDFLQMMMEIKNDEERTNRGDGTSLTEDEITAQCFVVFVGGFETSNTTMTFALLELAVHQDIQQKARDEIYKVLKKYENEITYDSLKEMEYLKQIVDETLRMYAPIGTIERVCTKNYKIPGTDVVIDKGTRVVIPIHGIHYDEEYYKDPQQFNPERFSRVNKQKLHPYAHIPFGEGPRVCLGMRFGLMETMVGLITVLRNYKVKLNERTIYPVKFDPHYFFANPSGGAWLNIEKIEK